MRSRKGANKYSMRTIVPCLAILSTPDYSDLSPSQAKYIYAFLKDVMVCAQSGQRALPLQKRESATSSALRLSVAVDRSGGAGVVFGGGRPSALGIETIGEADSETEEEFTTLEAMAAQGNASDPISVMIDKLIKGEMKISARGGVEQGRQGRNSNKTSNFIDRCAKRNGALIVDDVSTLESNK